MDSPLDMAHEKHARLRMKRGLIAAALFCLMSAHGAYYGAWAQSASVERNVKASPGHDVRVGIYTAIRPDCTSGPLPAIRLAAAPAHGAVTVKRATLKATNVKQCLAIDVPAFVAFYRPVPDFSGADDFRLEITFSGGRKEIQDFHVSVSSAAGAGQGI